MKIEGVTYYRFRVRFRLVDGSRRSWIRWSPGWNWVYDSIGRELYDLGNVMDGSTRISAL